MTKTIKVTKRHIKSGDPKDAWYSPICLAMLDIGFVKVSYFGAAYVETKDGGRRRIEIPRKAQVASSDLCNGDPVAPFSFEVEYPEEVLLVEPREFSRDAADEMDECVPMEITF